MPDESQRPEYLGSSAGPRCLALVPCAGTGSRSGANMPKQYVPLAGRPVVAHTLLALSQVQRINATLLVLSPDDDHFDHAVRPWVDASFNQAQSLWVARAGGATRAHTVLQGLVEWRRRGARDEDWVLVHDAARCLIQPAWIDRLIDECIDDEVGGLLAVPLADTLKQAQLDGAERVSATVDRNHKWAAQTPQMFRLGLLEAALLKGLAGSGGVASGAGITDESSAIEALGHAPRLVEGDVENIKLTYPADFALAERLLATRPASNAGPSASINQENAAMTASLRIGEGWDTHALVPGRPLVLGGVTIPHTMGLMGHSDADALLHAITDALLGAAGLGDIGRHFPDTDEAFRGANSVMLLAEAARRVREQGFELVNIDSTVIAQAPRLAAHIPAMRITIAAAVQLDESSVNVKAKTAEKMGPVGEGRAIEARAVCLLQARGA